jgi:hypothetical protein
MKTETMHRESRDPNALMNYTWETRHMSIFARIPGKPLDDIVYVTKAPTVEIAEWICSCHNQRLMRAVVEARVPHGAGAGAASGAGGLHRRKHRDAEGRRS